MKKASLCLRGIRKLSMPHKPRRNEVKMDIKDQITKLVDAVTKDDGVKKLFAENPVKAVEKVVGIDLPDDIINQVVQGVKGKISGDKKSDDEDQKEEKADSKFDIKDQITKLVDAVTKDDEVKKLFAENPVKAVEKVIGIDLPDDIINQVVQGVKAKVSLDKLSDAAGFLKNLF